MPNQKVEICLWVVGIRGTFPRDRVSLTARFTSSAISFLKRGTSWHSFALAWFRISSATRSPLHRLRTSEVLYRLQVYSGSVSISLQSLISCMSPSTCWSTTAVKTALRLRRSPSPSWATIPASSNTSCNGGGEGLMLTTTVSHRSVRVALSWGDTPWCAWTRMFPGWRSPWTKLSSNTWTETQPLQHH